MITLWLEQIWIEPAALQTSLLRSHSNRLLPSQSTSTVFHSFWTSSKQSGVSRRNSNLYPFLLPDSQPWKHSSSSPATSICLHIVCNTFFLYTPSFDHSTGLFGNKISLDHCIQIIFVSSFLCEFNTTPLLFQHGPKTMKLKLGTLEDRNRSTNLTSAMITGILQKYFLRPQTGATLSNTCPLTIALLSIDSRLPALCLLLILHQQ